MLRLLLKLSHNPLGGPWDDLFETAQDIRMRQWSCIRGEFYGMHYRVHGSQLTGCCGSVRESCACFLRPLDSLDLCLVNGLLQIVSPHQPVTRNSETIRFRLRGAGIVSVECSEEIECPALRRCQRTGVQRENRYGLL